MSTNALARPNSRRGFLAGLAKLPLIGGGVALIGSPTAAAVPVSDDLLDSYSEWLFYERRLLCEERWPGRRQESFVPVNTGATSFHFPNYPMAWQNIPQPSTRAAVVLASVGCRWQERER